MKEHKNKIYPLEPMHRYNHIVKNLSMLLLIVLAYNMSAQSNQPWNGKKSAVVITYDDAIDEHLDNAIPVLDSLGLKATFYITAYSTSMKNRMNEWRNLSDKGYELGNHTLFHPCIGSDESSWPKAEYDMRYYTVDRMVDETRMTNVFLQALDGKTKRTFAFTCGDMKISDSFFIEAMQNDFIASRAVRSEMHKINEIDLNNVDCYAVNGQSGSELIEWAKKAIETNSLLVILFHGVGGGNSLNVSIPAHREFLEYLKENEKDMWVAPMLEVAEYVKDYQSKKTFK